MAARHNPFSQRAHETILSVPGTLNGADISLDTLTDCQVFILDFTQAIYVDECTDCVLRIGPVSGFVFIRNCRNCIVSVACRQFRMKECEGMTVFLYAARDPHLEMSSDITIGPYNFAYPLQDQHFQKAGLDPKANLWSQIYDHTPAKEGRNWVLLDKEDYHAVSYEIEGLGQPVDPVVKPSLYVSGGRQEEVVQGSQVHTKKAKLAEKWEEARFGPDIIQEEEADKLSDQEGDSSQKEAAQASPRESFRSPENRPSARRAVETPPGGSGPRTPDPSKQQGALGWAEPSSHRSLAKPALFYPQVPVMLDTPPLLPPSQPVLNSQTTQLVEIHYTRQKEFNQEVGLTGLESTPLTATIGRASALAQPYHELIRIYVLTAFCILIAALLLLLALVLIYDFVDIHDGGLAILLFLLIVAFVGLLVWVTLLIRKTAKEGNGKLQVLFTADGPAYQAVGWELTGDLNVLKVSQKSTALAPLN